jgi:hypothetical protein
MISRDSAAGSRQGPDALLALLGALEDGDRGSPPLPVPATRERHASLAVLAGPGFILDLGTTLAGQAVLRGLTVLYVDGANAFDPYILSRLARDAGQPPKAILQRLHLSRAFTCHQLETLITERLPSAIARYRPGLVVVSGWSHLFHDENVPAREAFRLLQDTGRRLRSLAEAGCPILATHPEEPATPRLRPLGEILTRAATDVVRLREQEGAILAIREKPPSPHGPRPLQLTGERGVLWIRGHHRQEPPAAYPCSGR